VDVLLFERSWISHVARHERKTSTLFLAFQPGSNLTGFRAFPRSITELIVDPSRATEAEQPPVGVARSQRYTTRRDVGPPS
jgi:hypothetical protein